MRNAWVDNNGNTFRQRISQVQHVVEPVIITNSIDKHYNKTNQST